MLNFSKRSQGHFLSALYSILRTNFFKHLELSASVSVNSNRGLKETPEFLALVAMYFMGRFSLTVQKTFVPGFIFTLFLSLVSHELGDTNLSYVLPKKDRFLFHRNLKKIIFILNCLLFTLFIKLKLMIPAGNFDSDA